MRVIPHLSALDRSRATLVASWALALTILGWFVWQEHRSNIHHHQSLARLTVNGAAQTTALYLQDAANRLQQLAEREQELLSAVRLHDQDPEPAGRLALLLEFRFPELEGFALADAQGRILYANPPGYLTDERAERIGRLVRIYPAPMQIESPNGGNHFDLMAPWNRDGTAQGALLVSLTCEHLCGSLRAQAPAEHRVTLHMKDGGETPDASAAITAEASVPGTRWLVRDRVSPNTLSRSLRQTGALATLLFLVFLGGSLVFYVRLRRHERALARDGSHYRDLFERVPTARLLVDGETGAIRDANQAAATLFETPRSRLLRSGMGDLLTLGAVDLAGQLERLRFAGHICLDAELPGRPGEALRLDIACEPVENGEGELLLALRVLTDEAAPGGTSTENDEKLRAILDASADGVVMTDAAGHIEIFNPAAEMMFGYLKEEITGRHIRLIMPAGFENGQDLASWIPQGPASGMGTVREISGARKNGEHLPIRVSLSRVRLNERPHYVALVQDLTDLRRNEKKLAYLEQRDVLTGLLNRREFERRLDALLSFPDQPDTEYVLCYIDVDQFKVVNDTCGHVAGDDLLKQLAIVIRSQLRESQTIARLGGDEFGALLMDCSIERGEQICNGLLQTVRNFLFTWRDQSFDVAISIGLAGFRPHAESASLVLSQADVACHMAKRLGRDRIHVYHSGDADLIRHHGDMHLVAAINQALTEGRFHLFAQPIVPVSPARGSGIHYEVLVRMVDEDGRLVIPDDFIPAAERYILMPAIDRWVIGRLFSLHAESLSRWAERNPPEGRGFLFGINLSGTSLTDDGFLSYIKRQFRDYGIPYHAICFEITETAAVANLDRARSLIDELRSLGCSFALDDFGTGLSSYSYLKDLPVDYLKIDGSFVRNMTEDPVDYAMVDSINQIAHILGLRTIAEWAEDLSTLTQLRALNVDYAQGYGVGEMISIETFELPEPDVSVLPGRKSRDPQRITH